MSVKKQLIAIYGLSTETEKALPSLSLKYDIVGLLDSFQTSGQMFGVPIISLDDAMAKRVERIIVVARPGSCKAIAKKIGEFCRTNGIGLFDIRGKDLLERNRIVYNFKHLVGYKKADIIEQIREADVVSFDLFDTLVMRSVMTFSDVLKLLDVRLRKKGILISDFCNRRIGLEKKMSQGAAPMLERIYEKLLGEESSTVISARELTELEFDTDCSLLVPRKEMCELIHVANSLGKDVYITSESYYNKSQLEKIMVKCGITGVHAIIDSCEYNTGKTAELYDRLIECAGTKNIIHIGDDVVADIDSGKAHGLHTFQIYSGADLLDALGGLGLTENITSISDKIKVGMFCAEIFNSPFQFEDEDRRVCVDDTKSIGYLFCAPIISDFSQWFGRQTKEKQLENIWFCARDGYLMQKIFKMLYPELESQYLLTSRISSIRAGVETESDIQYVNSMKFSGTVEENLYTRFGIPVETISEVDVRPNEEGLLKYADVILSLVREKQANNKRYIKKLPLKEGKIAFFDFVAKGTSQMYVQKLVENSVTGLYFLQLEPEFMKDKNLSICPFYSEEERSDSAIFDNYYILETILTSPEPSVDEFDEKGNAVFAKETRSKKDIDCFMRAQEGILEYIRRYIDICPGEERTVNKRLDEILLMLIQNVKIKDPDFLELTIEDPFFNRMTNITDVL